MIGFFIAIEKFVKGLKARRNAILKLDGDNDEWDEGNPNYFVIYVLFIPCYLLLHFIPFLPPRFIFWILVGLGFILATTDLIRNFALPGKVAFYRFLYKIIVFTGFAFVIEFLYSLFSGK